MLKQKFVGYNVAIINNTWYYIVTFFLHGAKLYYRRNYNTIKSANVGVLEVLVNKEFLLQVLFMCCREDSNVWSNKI